jgi:predicted transcriptional regulator
MKRASQAARILALLQAHEWVGLPAILDLRIASFTRRLSDLKSDGWVIERREKRVGRARHSEYRLLGKSTDQVMQ